MKNLDQIDVCVGCVCMPVCAVYRATGGVVKCEHRHEEDYYVHKVRAEAHQITLTMKCGRCGAYVLEQDHMCPGCGAMFDGSVE